MRDSAKIHVLDEPIYREEQTNVHPYGNMAALEAPENRLIKMPFPYGFEPAFHINRLAEPTRTRVPKTVFVCSMGDIFGEWVPDDWIENVFEACASAPQHRYLFLTKNPDRVSDLAYGGILPIGDNYWFGVTINTPEEFYDRNAKMPSYIGRPKPTERNVFLSFEPIFGDIAEEYKYYTRYSKWVIIGAETGSRKEKVIPHRSWIEGIVDVCYADGVPLFMKRNLKDVWGPDLIQQYPW